MNWAIDENVIAVANDLARVDRGEAPLCPQVDDACRIACAKFLMDAIKSGVILLDDADVVFRYYRRKASLSGQPGSGDVFLRELYRSSYSGKTVVRVNVGLPPNFGLPIAFTVSGFDPDDMIYVALARASMPAEVVNAADSDYANTASSLAEIGVPIRELCS